MLDLKPASGESEEDNDDHPEESQKDSEEFEKDLKQFEIRLSTIVAKQKRHKLKPNIDEAWLVRLKRASVSQNLRIAAV